MKIIDYFDIYTNQLGWKIIPVHPYSKNPIIKKWNKNYNKEKAREIVSMIPNCNLGLLLGDIIDVEGDSPQANERLSNLTKNYPHPTYQSKKSTHHLFLSPDPNLTRISFQDIEFRGNLHQSLIPPSTNYTWISLVKIPKLPDSLLKLYNKNKKNSSPSKEWETPYCNNCGKYSRPIRQERFKIECFAFKQKNLPWQCHKCRDDIRYLCKKIKKYEKS